jgi:hypothetical protein
MKYEPFDPTDPAEIAADNFRVQVCELALSASNDPHYQILDPVKKVESFMGGVLVGLIGVCFASVEAEGRDAMLEAIKEYLPQARDQAEAIMIGSGADAIGSH